MATGELEIEHKFDADEAFVLPDLGGLDGVATADPPVEHRLEAVYHDTPDLRLLRARITLRRRTGGPDAGWHLKLPADPARREVHAPLGRAVKNPPKALLEPVAGILRGAATVPVATLQTRRIVTALRDPAGRVLAEVADDAVAATTPGTGPGQPAELHSWREVEVELVDGDEALLAVVGQHLTAAGARPSTSVSKAGRVLAGRMAQDGGPAGPERGKKGKKGKNAGPDAGKFVRAALREQVGGLQTADLMLRTDQPDAVHQLRVAARRLRSTLAAFRAVLDVAATAPLREELAWLGGELSAARDDEVALAHLHELVLSQPEDFVLGPVAARIQQTAIREGQVGLDRALRTVSEPRYVQLLDALHALLDAPPFTARASDPVQPVLRNAIRRSVKRLRRHLATARRAPDDARYEALHAVRKAAKRVRYAAEIGPVKPLAREAERVQTLLGELQDSGVTREHCRRLGLAAFADGENAFTYGRLHALEQARADRVEQEFLELEPELRRTVKRATK